MFIFQPAFADCPIFLTKQAWLNGFVSTRIWPVATINQVLHKVRACFFNLALHSPIHILNSGRSSTSVYFADILICGNIDLFGNLALLVVLVDLCNM
jgi:hypothetical protein